MSAARQFRVSLSSISPLARWFHSSHADYHMWPSSPVFFCYTEGGHANYVPKKTNFFLPRFEGQVNEKENTSQVDLVLAKSPDSETTDKFQFYEAC